MPDRLPRRVNPAGGEHGVVGPELPDDDLVPLLLLAQPHNLGLEQLDLLDQVDALVAP